MKIIALSLGAAVLFSQAALAESVVSVDGKVRTFIFRHPAKSIDPAKAVPMRLPKNPQPLPSLVELTIEATKLAKPTTGSFVPGGKGDDKQTQGGSAADDASASPVVTASAAGGRVGPQDYGSSGQPYTVARTPGASVAPYRQAGLLFFNPPTGTDTLTCTAALIKPGVLVTAAHCIVAFGTTAKNTNFVYIPAYDPAAKMLTQWNAVSASVLSTWTAGTAPCATRGTVCRDDVGIITLAFQTDSSGNAVYPGNSTGWFGYSTDSYSYSQGQAEVAQLGYAKGFDHGNVMQRVDSQGSTTKTMSLNTVIGSPLGDGSDGGPWVVNLGTAPKISNDHFGKEYAHNIVVGVTSWSTGTASSQKQAGASPFLSSNIGSLVTGACFATPSAC